MTTPSHTHGVILFAHGSRDSLWNTPIQSIADHIAQHSPALMVRCAYLEWTSPTLAAVVSDMVSKGVPHIRIVPLFLGIGKHAREDIPKLVKAVHQCHPDLTVELRPSVGEHSDLLECLSRIAVEGLAAGPGL